MATINHRLTKEQYIKIEQIIPRDIYGDMYYVTAKTKFIKDKFNALYVRNPNPYGSLKFKSEKDRTWFLLQI